MAKFDDVPDSLKLGIVAAVALCATVALYFLFFQPISAQNRTAEVKLQGVMSENDKLRPYERNLPELNRTIDALKMQLENLQRIVPDEKEADQFMHAMQNEAVKAGVEVRRYAARPLVSREFYTEVPFDMQIDGPYYSMVNFFDRVSKLERIINVSNLQVGAIKGGDVKPKLTYSYAPRETVLATCVATTFFSHNGPPSPAKKAAKKK